MTPETTAGARDDLTLIESGLRLHYIRQRDDHWSVCGSCGAFWRHDKQPSRETHISPYCLVAAAGRVRELISQMEAQ